MATETKIWTLAEVHSLPDDGNKYELIRGELFVTPAPTEVHETISARLTRILDPYVAAQGLGYVFHPRAVVRFEGSEVEPDLMVRQPKSEGEPDWDRAPTPVLVVEILSPTTRRRDRAQKRDFYTEVGIAEYWLIDPERKNVTVVRPNEPDLTTADKLIWSPAGTSASLEIEVQRIFE
jgi:Uma2 family endonuclease